MHKQFLRILHLLTVLTGTILDVFKPTTAVTYYTKISEIIQLSFAADSLTALVDGETITGATSGVTASNRGLIGRR